MTERGAPPVSRTRRVLDAATYAVGLTVLAVAVSVPPGFVLWGGLPGVKFGLFLVGFAYFGYATILLQPSRPTEDGSDDPREATTVEETLDRYPPLERYEIPPPARYSPGAKLMLASLLTLGLSFVMEAVFGVGVTG